jgi:RNA polymerase sigma-70 factor (ECF subfamily)
VELERLHGAHATAVRAYALRRTDPATADDVCAEVWAIAWRRLDRIPEDALPWLFGVARRVLANQRRSERRRAALRGRLLETGFGWNDSVPPPAIPSDRRLADALASLKPADREALLLVAWEGLEPARAAAALGVSAATFSVRMHRARKRLAATLDRAAVPKTPQEVSP